METIPLEQNLNQVFHLVVTFNEDCNGLIATTTKYVYKSIV